jgi:hypothetical protein
MKQQLALARQHNLTAKIPQGWGWDDLLSMVSGAEY